MKKADIIIIIIVIIISLGIGIGRLVIINNKYDKKYAEIKVKGKLYKKVDLSDINHEEIIKISTDLGENTVIIKNGGAYIIEANCPDKLCVKSGFIDEVGEVVVCLPHELVIEIKGKKEPVDEKSY